MGLLSDPKCAACGIEEASALHFICRCPSLAKLRAQIFGKPILSVSEYEEMSGGSFGLFQIEKSRKPQFYKCKTLEIIKNCDFFIAFTAVRSTSRFGF
jgi:hypothetical protein